MKDYVRATAKNALEFIQKATSLGFNELVLLAEPKEAVKICALREELAKNAKIKLYFGVLAQNKAQIPKKCSFDVIAKLGTSEQSVFSGLTTIMGVETSTEKDFVHQRRSGVNHVLLKQYNQHGIELVASYASLQQLTLARRAQVFGRIMQNAKLCKKHAVSYTLYSLASKPEEMRHPKDVCALARILCL